MSGETTDRGWCTTSLISHTLERAHCSISGTTVGARALAAPFPIRTRRFTVSWLMAESPSFRAGALDCVRITDGELPYPAALLLANAPPDELARALAGELDSEGMILGRFRPLLIRSPDAVVLVDTGIGRFAPGEGAGRLRESLEGAGVEPSDIDYVVLTHAHPDHLGGLIAEGNPVFAQARHVILDAEWEFWTAAGSERPPEPIAVGFKEALVPLRSLGRLDLLDDDAGVVPGVRLVRAPGHTPGHAILELGEPPAALFLADAVLHEVGFEHPEWTSAIDVDPELAVETRRALLHRAADERLLVAGYHLARQGYVERDGAVFGLVAESA
jgi:glyoxylase-like metal-dependent hydrolase (beta-lactamase superfamily II)